MDGWNTSELSYTLELLDKLQEVNYELNNCVKGAYTYCNTYAKLSEYIKSLCESLSDSVDGIDYLDEMEETEEE